MKNICAKLLLSVCGLLLAGCGTPTTYVDPAGSRLVASTGRINVQDFQQAADAMVNSLIDQVINPGHLRSASSTDPALLAISRISNNTGQQIDTDLLVKKIRIALMRTGKVQTSTTINYGGPEDPLAAELQQKSGAPVSRNPDYTLSGKIIEDRTKAGSVKQSAFVFQLSLSSPNGIAVWEDEKTIIKQGSHNTIGF